jgi:hypothetical protein
LAPDRLLAGRRSFGRTAAQRRILPASEEKLAAKAAEFHKKFRKS